MIAGRNMDYGLPMRILIVEDNRDIAANIGDYFEARGNSVDFAMDGISGMHLALTRDFDVIILDIMLPGLGGLEFCSKLRQEAGKETPVLMLTARDTLADKLAGFDAGADDYLVKPFALQELEARVRALGKRGQPLEPQTLKVADLELDNQTLTVTRDGQRITLNPAGLKILTCLMEASPNVVKRSELEQLLWSDSPPDSDALRSHMYALRRAIDRPFPRPLLQTLHGIGYRLVDPDETPP